MVALLTPNAVRFAGPQGRRSAPSLRLVKTSPPSVVARALDLVRAFDSFVLGAAAIGVVILLSVVGVRLAQGEPPSTFQIDPSVATVQAAPAVEVGDRVVTVELGQNLWDIARMLQSESDTGSISVRSLVESLALHNGGSSVAIGQEIVVPASLLSD